MTRQSIIAAIVGAAGWVATLSLHEIAAAFAGFATGFWMIAQGYVLLRRQRCTNYSCPRRKP